MITHTFTLKSDAQTWATEQEHSTEIGILKGQAKRQPVTLHDLLCRYEIEVLPLKRAPDPERYMLRVMKAHPMALKLLRHLSADDFAKFRDDRLKSVKASTLRRQLNVLRHALKTARNEWGWSVPYDDLTLLNLPSVGNFHVERVTDNGLAKLLSETDRQRNRYVSLAIRLAISTGMRRGELLALRWSDVDLDRQRLLIRTSKNGRPRVVPLSPDATQLFNAERSAEEYVIPITANCLKLGFSRARQMVGGGFRFHDLRHEAISRFFELGLTIPEVQMISGHRTLSQLSRYSHADVSRVAAKLATKPS
jgi:integrase